MLKEERVASGMTHRRLSELSGVPERTIQHWEKVGVRNAKAVSVASVARALGTTVERLLGEERI